MEDNFSTQQGSRTVVKNLRDITNELFDAFHLNLDDPKAVQQFKNSSIPDLLGPQVLEGEQNARCKVDWALRPLGFEYGPEGAAKATAYIDAHTEDYAAVIERLSQGDPARFNEVLSAIAPAMGGAPNYQAAVYRLLIENRIPEAIALANNINTIDSANKAYNEAAPKQKRLLADLEQLQANEPLEQAAVSRLGEQQEAYLNLRKAVGNDADARLALQLLLLEGKLQGGTNSAGENLLTALEKTSQQSVTPPLDAGALLRTLIREVATPSAIDQRNRGTCTVTSLQIHMALKQPAEYVRLVSGLASPAGATRMASGQWLNRLPGTEQDDGTGRTASSRLWQAALMDFANGDNKYSNEQDAHITPDGANQGTGLRDAETARAMDNVLNTPSRILKSSASSPAEVFTQIGQALSEGKPVLAALYWGDLDAFGKSHGQHEVVLKSIDGDQVAFYNPWGAEEKMSVVDFQKVLVSAITQ